MSAVVYYFIEMYLGNFAAGSVLVCLAYRMICRRDQTSSVPPSTPEKS